MPDTAGTSLAAEIAATIGENYDRVMVLSTARRHGRGPQRLPDRLDRGSRIAAVQVETDAEAADLIRRIDRPGRRFYVDVEAKQDLRLLAVARATVRSGSVATIKPNDITVDALDAVLDHSGISSTEPLTVAVYGTGNLAFKLTLRLAERGAQVSLHGRDQAKVNLLVAAINAILPRHNAHLVTASLPPVASVNLLVSAVSAEAVIGRDWLERLSSPALCIDVGINNLAPEFIEGALAAGHRLTRLDVRSAGDPLPAEPNPFFTEIAGHRDHDGIPIVAGGYIGHRGDVVVDEIANPTLVIGVANGTGGLLPPDSWPPPTQEAVARMRRAIAAKD